MKKKPVERKEIEVCGEIVNNIDMPEMYRLATANKMGLEKTVRGVMEKQGYKKVGAVLAMLESDLG
jgi:hypothetical protein